MADAITESARKVGLSKPMAKQYAQDVAEKLKGMCCMALFLCQCCTFISTFLHNRKKLSLTI